LPVAQQQIEQLWFDQTQAAGAGQRLGAAVNAKFALEIFIERIEYTTQPDRYEPPT
jgi:hypothetical protein